ncbi:MAG: O-antigen ligase family protein [Candidatus Aminicenantes bacterium]|nr:MAG: O-antigen ligase family protein [Candidatus Aminicenantes bacterium]
MGLIIFSPLPAASVHEWSILVIQLTVIILMICFFLIKEKPRCNERLSKTLRWPKVLFIGFWIFLFFQIIPLPKFLTKILSPGTYAFQKLHAPDFSSIKFMSVSLVPSISLKTALALLSYFLIGFLIVMTIKKRSQIIRLCSVICVMGIFEAAYGLFGLYSRNLHIFSYENKMALNYASGTFLNRNHFAGYLEMIIPITIGLIISQVGMMPFSPVIWKEKLVRLSERKIAVSILLALGVILMSLALIFSRSRTATVLLAFIFVVFVLHAFLNLKRNGLQNKATKIFIISIFIIILFLSFYIGRDTIFQRFAVRHFQNEGRPAIWANTLKIIYDYPIFGSGLGTFAALFPIMEADGEISIITHAHNDYLEYMSDVGAVGFFLFFGGIFFILIQCANIWKRRIHPLARALGIGGIIAIISLLLHGVTDFNLQIPSNMLLFSVILSITLVTVTRKSAKSR